MEKDIKYMKRALYLAEKGQGKTSPNPLVGAVIVKDDRIIGEGYHEYCGGLHAERNALKCAKERGNNPKGSTMYVTLEPCCHYGKTPPCTEAIIENQISRVVIGSNDPNPKVSGKGIKILRDAGIDVTTDLLREECDRKNEIFIHYITTGLPFVMMKYAMTMDGKIATVSGKSKWITSEKALENVHRDRNRFTGIMAGIGTVIADNPTLTARIPGGINPTRIICDTSLRIPKDSNIVKTSRDVKTFIATDSNNYEKIKFLESKGIQILKPGLDENQHINVNQLMTMLGNEGIDSILLEGGGTLNWSMLEAGAVNKVKTFIAPKIFGGDDAKTPVRGTGVNLPSECIKLETEHIEKIGPDIMIESRVIKCLQD